MVPECTCSLKSIKRKRHRLPCGPKDCRRPKESHEDCPCQRTMPLQASRVSKCWQASSTRTLPWTTFGGYQTRDTPGCRKSDNSLRAGGRKKRCWAPCALNGQYHQLFNVPKKQRPNKAIWRGNGVEMCFIAIHTIHAYMIPVMGTAIFHSYSYDTIECEKRKATKNSQVCQLGHLVDTCHIC